MVINMRSKFPSLNCAQFSYVSISLLIKIRLFLDSKETSSLISLKTTSRLHVRLGVLCMATRVFVSELLLFRQNLVKLMEDNDKSISLS